MAQKVIPIPKPERPRHYIREWRKYRGLTQERLAERLDLTGGAISQLETGVTGYTQETLEGIAVALNCEPGDLLSRDPNIEGAVLDLLRLLRQKDQATVMAIINGLPDAGTGTND